MEEKKGKEREKLPKLFEPEQFKTMMLRIAEIFFIVAAFFIIFYIILIGPTLITNEKFSLLPVDVISGIESYIETLVGDTFLLIALMEIYEGVVDLEKGRVRTVIDIMDAALSFVLREIIETIYEEKFTFDLLVAYAILIISIGTIRELIARGALLPIKKKDEGSEGRVVRQRGP